MQILSISRFLFLLLTRRTVALALSKSTMVALTNSWDCKRTVLANVDWRPFFFWRHKCSYCFGYFFFLYNFSNLCLFLVRGTKVTSRYADKNTIRIGTIFHFNDLNIWAFLHSRLLRTVIYVNYGFCQCLEN